MYGAIIGDLAGSIYEYNQLKELKPIKMNKIIEDNSFYSDDTILTIAILDAIENNQNYEEYLKKYIKKYKEYKPNFTPYFKTIFSPNLLKWSESNNKGISHGNGAMMRISGVGHMFNTKEEVIKNTYLATIPSHNSKEAIKYSTMIAIIIFYLRKGYSKEEILKYLNLEVKYIPFTKFNITCEETFNNCIYAFANSNSFEDAIRKTLLMGGDTDTNCAIVGSMAEAAYGIDKYLIEEANKKIPKEFIKTLKKTK